MRWAKSSVISRFAPPAREILVRPGPSQFLQNYDFIFIAYLKTVDFEVLKSDLNASNFSSTFTNVLRISLHVPPKTLQRSKTFSLLNSYIYPLHSLVLEHTRKSKHSSSLHDFYCWVYILLLPASHYNRAFSWWTSLLNPGGIAGLTSARECRNNSLRTVPHTRLRLNFILPV